MSHSLSPQCLDLPFLGVGISVTADRATQVLASEQAARDISLSSLGFLNIGLSSTTVVREALASDLDAAGLASVVHLEEMNLVGGPLDEHRLRQIAQHCRALKPRWVQEDLGLWMWDQMPLVEHMVGPILDESSLCQAVSNIERIMEVTRLPFLAENPPMYFALGDIDLLRFMREVSVRSQCGLLLDLGHFVSYCLCTKRDPLEYLATDRLCLERVVEVHLAGYSLTEVADSAEPIWFDRHDLPLTSQALDLLAYVVRHAPAVKAITLEVEGAPDSVIRSNVARVLESVQVEAIA